MTKRTVLITGASRGIGKTIAKQFKELGYAVLTPSREEMDLSSDLSVNRYLASLKTPVDVLINNAGINPLAAVTEITDENIEKVMRVNFGSPLRLIRALAPGMRKRKFGRVVNISSFWSVVTKEKRGLYAASKSALNGITRTAAVELAPDNVLVNSVSPGFVDTELTRQNLSAQDLKKIAAKIPLGRLATTEEIARLAVFLGSEENTYLTGQNIVIDGGYTCL